MARIKAVPNFVNMFSYASSIVNSWNVELILYFFHFDPVMGSRIKFIQIADQNDKIRKSILNVIWISLETPYTYGGVYVDRHKSCRFSIISNVSGQSLWFKIYLLVERWWFIFQLRKKYHKNETAILSYLIFPIYIYDIYFKIFIIFHKLQDRSTKIMRERLVEMLHLLIFQTKKNTKKWIYSLELFFGGIGVRRTKRFGWKEKRK